jgi:hypothetical protein
MSDNRVINVFFPANVYIGQEGCTGLTSKAPAGTYPTALQYLGWSRNGVEIEIREYVGEVPTDENAGEEGPPTDKQFFGATATIRLDLTKYDPIMVNNIRGHLSNLAAESGSPVPGTYLPGDVGKLKFSSTNMFRLLIASTNQPGGANPEVAGIWNFPRVDFSEPKSVNAGSKFSAVLLMGTAYPLNVAGVNVLWNESTA